MKTTRLALALVLVCMLIGVAASAADYTRIYTGGTADGGIFRYWWYNGSDNWVDTGGTQIGIDYYYGYWAYGVTSMRISSLAGRTLAPNSVSLHFYTDGMSSISLNRFDFDPAGTVAWSYTNGSRTSITNLSSGAGWQSVDVTSHVQTQIDAGYNWAGFIFRTTNGSGSLGMSEGGKAAYLEIVPEPSGLLALMTGGTGIVGMFLRRRK